MNRRLKTYGLYDTLDYECLVYLGDINEISKYTGQTINNIRSCMSRGMKLLRRYEVVKIEEDEE